MRTVARETRPDPAGPPRARVAASPASRPTGRPDHVLHARLHESRTKVRTVSRPTRSLCQGREVKGPPVRSEPPSHRRRRALRWPPCRGRRRRPDRLLGRGPARLPARGTPTAETTTNQTERITDLWVGSWIAALIVGIITWGLMLWCVVAYRKRKDDDTLPVQIRYHLPLEIMYTSSRSSWSACCSSTRRATCPRSRTRRRARRHDPGRSASSGAGTSTTSTTSTSTTRPASARRGRGPERRPASTVPDALPAGRRARRVQLDSRDVIHSFWIPAFLYKKDMIPGRTNTFQVDPDPRGHVRRQVRRALRRVPLGDALQRRGGLAARSTTRTWRSCATAARPAQLGLDLEPAPGRGDRRSTEERGGLRTDGAGTPARTSSRSPAWRRGGRPSAARWSSGSPRPTTRRSGTCT